MSSSSQSTYYLLNLLAQARRHRIITEDQHRLLHDLAAACGYDIVAGSPLVTHGYDWTWTVEGDVGFMTSQLTDFFIAAHDAAIINANDNIALWDMALAIGYLNSDRPTDPDVKFSTQSVNDELALNRELDEVREERDRLQGQLADVTSRSYQYMSRLADVYTALGLQDEWDVVAATRDLVARCRRAELAMTQVSDANVHPLAHAVADLDLVAEAIRVNGPAIGRRANLDLVAAVRGATTTLKETAEKARAANAEADRLRSELTRSQARLQESERLRAVAANAVSDADHSKFIALKIAAKDLVDACVAVGYDSPTDLVEAVKAARAVVTSLAGVREDLYERMVEALAERDLRAAEVSRVRAHLGISVEEDVVASTHQLVERHRSVMMTLAKIVQYEED